MALRTRLVLTSVGLVATALFLVAGATFGALQDWLQAATPEALLASSSELTSRIAFVLAGTSAAALVCLTLVAAHLVRRGLRPLDRIVDAAADIGAGDLERRVDAAPPGTEVGRLAYALNAMLAQLQAAFREREESEERLRRFVADASHELRTPVATIRGYAELFRRGARSRPEDAARAMERIESEAARMGLLVEELLLLTRLDAGRPMERAAVDLGALAADAVADALAVDPGRPVTLVRSGPVPVLGDPARLRQVAGNLLTNVLDHTPDGTPATVRVTTSGSYAVLEVSDEGPGIDAEQAERVFERFYRGNRQAGGQRGGGSGLGLSIVAAVVSAHGGEVRVLPGEGATFRVRLPRA
ncbi:HAMP domain-containing histidine kinase [Nonomuraea mesophila]|uniref:histidine kinase n=1 Tax=Nonomuraea mesophila TaxID=2530382 RepID=A0A4R5EI26_9ACTN|nr:HAMP domain-containing sensor histidine kinase [Nonomuraea mesophila]TDE34165.1 HAMP domain-containing histidine kinase [Nonomuraea mesophila]